MPSERNDFIRDIIDEDLRTGRHTQVATRFPPEPNGYLHIGHAKAICVDFGIARDYGGTCNLRYDDTNPTKEDVEYVESIERDVRWLGFAPTAVLFSADYFPKMYELAERLIREGKAYVDDLTDAAACPDPSPRNASLRRGGLDRHPTRVVACRARDRRARALRRETSRARPARSRELTSRSCHVPLGSSNGTVCTPPAALTRISTRFSADASNCWPRRASCTPSS
jgi:glutamyl/glutaminyl-tRNA synthetase